MDAGPVELFFLLFFQMLFTLKEFQFSACERQEYTRSSFQALHQIDFLMALVRTIS
jgi:hypothetical protein